MLTPKWRDGLDIENGEELQSVLENLAETIAWCTPRIDKMRPRDCLRTMDLTPNPLIDGKMWIVDSVSISRYRALGDPNKFSVPAKQVAKDLAGGRLLLSGLDDSETPHVQQVSDGYFDRHQLPPWDTWVAYIYEANTNYLVSWVPKEFIDLAMPLLFSNWGRSSL